MDCAIENGASRRSGLVTDALFERVRAIVTAVAGPLRFPHTVTGETPRWDGGFWLDSVELLEVVLACQQEFPPKPDAGAALDPEALRTLGALAAFIRNTRGD